MHNEIDDINSRPTW